MTIERVRKFWTEIVRHEDGGSMPLLLHAGDIGIRYRVSTSSRVYQVDRIIPSYYRSRALLDIIDRGVMKSRDGRPLGELIDQLSEEHELHQDE